MHEISVLKRAVDLAEQTAIDNNIDRIAYITLEVGELSGYLPVFFEKYFEVVIEDRPIFEGAELKMIRPRGEGLCLDCHAMYNVMANEGRCPKCGSRNKKILGGQQFLLKEIGFVEPAPDSAQ
ncbi:MAG: hydrogenase maturation nickel metallochaperone HypA [Acutalibacteraceae bacterium]|nr:hydrogenase maturation nickel metallochaperone HypA [Clostridia bacterium]MBQ1549096.1 hydrogenase maturation nickel metallochaperone HypA [Clostridia bacterium]MDO5453192.1 hydrogenase maturation nickel metallochaperone HypA [Eubacteriales bacterium]MEE1188322.1 hydrogenase maturation nickel metallochaperone HypA [Acutalibacteraceae bacterium]MEE3312123.1 hydrogenase maturation nickel metallochaperone HypA [Acutalibacteraceae bacterium]